MYGSSRYRSRIASTARRAASAGNSHGRRLVVPWNRTRGESAPNWDQRTCLNSLLNAVVQHRLGQTDEARRQFAKVRERLKKGEQEKGNAETFPVHICNWLSCQVLLREFEALLKVEPVDKNQEPVIESHPTEP